LKNTDIWPEKSLHAVLRKLGAQSYDLDFAVTSDRSLQPCDTASSECTIANIGSDTPYFLDITGTFQIGGTFEYVWVPPGSEYPASTSSTNTAQSMPMTVSSIPTPLSSNAIHLPIPVSRQPLIHWYCVQYRSFFIAQNLKNGLLSCLFPRHWHSCKQ